MDKELFIQKIQEIGTCEDDVQRRTLLAEVNDGILQVYDKNNELTTENNQYKEDNEDLRRANMDLFKRVGKDLVDTKGEDDGKDEDLPEEKPKRKYEDLFKERTDK